MTRPTPDALRERMQSVLDRMQVGGLLAALQLQLRAVVHDDYVVNICGSWVVPDRDEPERRVRLNIQWAMPIGPWRFFADTSRRKRLRTVRKTHFETTTVRRAPSANDSPMPALTTDWSV